MSANKNHQSNRIELTAEECYCGILEFYQLIVTKMGYSLNDKTRLDCRKIDVTEDVMKQIFAYYMKELLFRKEEIAQGWIFFGPKASIPEEGYIAIVHKGFIGEVTS